MAEAVVSFVTERLGDLLFEEANFLCGVSSEVEEVKAELKRMQCFLKDADARQDDEEERVRNWIAEIRDLAYRTEDVLETFAVKVVSRREGKGIKKIAGRFAGIFSEGTALHKVGSEIRSIKSRITSITESLQTYGLKNIGEGESSNSAAEKQRWLRISHPHLIEEDFVGMDNDVKQVVSLLVDNNIRSQVISIWGMGGQGKTTIAKKLYNHTDVRCGFQRFGWTCITQQCQRKDVFQEILRELVPEKREEVLRMGDTELVQLLHRVLQEKNCLVVLDDLWALDDWKSLRPAFPIGDVNVCSKVLLTTRKDEVANVGVVHKLKFLNENEGWELLKKKAFPRDYAPDFRVEPELEKLGKEMVQQCKGLPLAISVLGGILKGKSASKDWAIVNKYVGLYLGRGEGIEQDQGPVARVLGLSFSDLPYKLKPCFIYLGNFPEDHSIDAQKVCQKWIAEGLVSREDRGMGETMMDVAERYMIELARRSMVQIELYDEESQPSPTTRFKSCQLHDLMRDLSLSKGKKEDFLHIIDSRLHVHDSVQRLLSDAAGNTKTHRLAFYLDKEMDGYINPSEKNEASRRFRSLLFFNVCRREALFLQFCSIKDFKLVRVLDFKGFFFEEKKLPQELSNLIHLRYLSFRDCILGELPSSTGNLRYLQTLDLRVNEGYWIIIPNVILKMKRLMHLYLPSTFRLKDGKKLRLNGLTKLETLEVANAEMCDVKDIVTLTNLRQIYLEILDFNLEDLASIVNYINVSSTLLRQSDLCIRHCESYSQEGLSLHLRELFRCHILRSLSLFGHIGKLPVYDHHHHFSSSMTRITLNNSELDEDPMTTLERLPNLRFLSLGQHAYLGKEIICSTTGFPQLRILELFDLPNLERWCLKEGAMPQLYDLWIFHCYKLEMVPEGLRFLVFLKELTITGMTEEFLRRVQVVDGEEGEDFGKVRHVPSIRLSTNLLTKKYFNSKKGEKR